MASVRLDGMLKEFSSKLSFDTRANTVRAVLEELEAAQPRLKFRLRDESGALRRFIRVFVNGEDIREKKGLDTALSASDSVDVLHSIQGG
ncbi:MAG: MoaD/ThiS family protein [Thermoplasmata archaeon]|nr:MoaD/ThiS family protein [Thermoplasmata archaeon]